MSVDDQERISLLIAAAAPGARIIDTLFLTGGLTNRNYEVRLTPAGGQPAPPVRVVARLGAPGGALGIDRVREAALLGHAAAQDLGAPVLHMNIETGDLVTGYLPGIPASDLPLTPPSAVELARLVTRIQALPAQGLSTADPRVLAQRYLTFARAHGVATPPAVAAHAAAVPMIDWQPTGIAHHDVNPWNVLLAPGDPGERAVWLLDWEYGGRGDAVFDLATISAWWQLDQPAEALLIEALATALAEPPEPLWLRLEGQRVLFHVREWAWAARQFALGRREPDIVEQLEREERWLAAQ